MKKNKRTGMATAVLLTAMSVGVATADTVKYRGAEEVIIKFDEPVVSMGVVENGWNDKYSAEDRGLNLFDITGDPQYVPTARWVDQDQLQLTFVKGTASATKYRLAFRPGSDKYLSGAKMPKPDFEFTPQPQGLSHAGVQPGVRGISCCVLSGEQVTREQINFSPASPVRYEFREITKRYPRQYGKSVPAVASEMKVKHLNGSELRRLLNEPERYGLKPGLEGLQSFSPEQVVSGRVLVTSAEPLDATKEWALFAIAEKGSGFESGDVGGMFVPSTDLPTGVSLQIVKVDNSPSLQMGVCFAAPVAEADVPAIFRNMEISVGGTQATTAEDGMSKTLVLGDKTISFRLLPLPENRIEAYAVYGDMRKPDGTLLSNRVYYDLPYTNIFAIAVEGVDDLPVTADVVIKADTAAMLGQSLSTDHRHRITLNAAAPVLRPEHTPDNPALLPLNGEHCLRMECINNAEVEVRMARLSAEQFIEHRETLSKIDENALEHLAELTYQLRLLQKRIEAGIDKESEAKETIKSYKRRISQLKKLVPDYDAISKSMGDVSFGTPVKFDTTGQGNGTLKSAELLIDLDALNGTPAGPGMYLVSVRTKTAPNVRAALREVGLAEDLFDFEVWYAVQLTDLHLTNADKALVCTGIADGNPKASGTLYNITNGFASELGEVKDGVTILPQLKMERRKTPVLMVRCGDDYRAFVRYSNSARMNTDRRIMVLKDRTLYRPGETVHMRGVLREVSHLGEPSMPHVKSVELIVSRPNRKELVRKKIKLNDYGAFDFEFDLPKGDEDIVGTYRITILADGNQYREEDFVECQEFRRDAFTAKGELKMNPVRPEEFTYTVTATDLNGAPLSGARVELNFSLDYSDENYDIPGIKSVPPHMESKDWQETLTLDAEGKATYTGKLDYKHREALMCGQAVISIDGYVVNDREESMLLGYARETIHPADFRVVLDDRLTLYSTVKNEEGKREVLQRDQSVNLRLVVQKPREEVLPNGIVLTTFEPVTLWQGDITVPANSINGVPTDILKHWETYINSLNPNSRDDAENMLVEIRGKDPEGREFLEREIMYSWRLRRTSPSDREQRGSTCKIEDRTLKLSSTFENEGQATVVVNSVAGARSAAVVAVKKGENTWDIPLLDNEYGDVNVAVMLAVQADNRYTRMEYTTGSAEAERVQTKLGVEFSLPQPHPAPGAEITLNGRIVTPEGKPLAATEVTLFAVDKGMLSVSGGHHVPNPGTFFTKVWVAGIHPQFEQIPAPLNLKFGEYPTSLIPGIWMGEIVGPGLGMGHGMNHNCVVVSHKKSRAMGGAVYQCAAPAPQACVTEDCMEGGDLGDGLGSEDYEGEQECAAPMACESAKMDSATDGAALNRGVRSGSGAMDDEEAASGTVAPPRLRTNFVPVAVWAPSLKTDADGRFTVNVKLPDTLTTYQVYAVALGQDGKCFGYAESEFTVNQPVMITPGTPLFMSVGDRLRLPLTITNNTETDATWTVTLEGAAAPQQITLKAKSTSTLYFDYTAVEEGERKLHWEALAAAGSDAVEGTFEVKFPAPVLREAHRLVLQEGAEPLKVGALPAPELATSTRGKVEIQLSANPLLHLNECMELTLGQGYGNTEWFATSLLPWMLHERMAPFSPTMAAIPAAEARRVVLKGIARLAKCQRRDGGMGYWPSESYFCRCAESSPWASAYAGLVLTIAQDNGYTVPEHTMPRLREYLTKYLAEQRKDPEVWAAMSPHILYAAGRTLGDDALIDEALQRALAQLRQDEDGSYGMVAIYHPRACCMYWFNTSRSAASLNFLAEMHKNKETCHESFLKWMRCVGHDYRHATTWDGGWMLIALHEYLRLTPAGNAQATVTLENGQQLTLGNGPTVYTPAHTPTLAEIPTTITRTDGTAYVSVKFKAQPEQTEYPGVTEKGLQVTRIYEKRGEDGAWRPATEFNVGDVVRVTLTCAKGEKDLEYFVLEDYLPSNMEAINPEVPSQTAGLEWQPWSQWFDNREFQAHRVRGFCTRWGGRDLLNMSYYARVKRAGEAMAPPASAQLLYEPQTYGLSPNTKVISK